MGRDVSQKLKLIRMLDILRTDTCEEFPVTTEEFCSKLKNEFGIKCDRRTLSEDIKYLQSNGFDIISEWKGGHKKVYYMNPPDDIFSIPELRLIQKPLMLYHLFLKILLKQSQGS